MAKLAKSAHTWRFVAASPPREVFAVMEQLIGTAPYRYEVTGEADARIVEHRRRGFFGQWSKPRGRIRWVACRAAGVAEGTRVEVSASSGGGLVAKAMGKADRGPVTRALQLVRLLTQGATDTRTVYRDRRIPPGPVSLVASWAGTGYRLFTEPDYRSARGAEIHTATEVEAVGVDDGPFVNVRLNDGTTGWVERDQVVAAPGVATRQAQSDVARFV